MQAVNIRTARIDGAFLSRISRRQILSLVGRWVDGGEKGRCITPMNVGKLVAMQGNERLARCVASSSLIIADGAPLLLAARLLGEPVPERITGVDLMDDLLRLAAERGYGVFFLGGRAEVLAELLRRCRRRHQGLKIAGSRHGYFAAEEEEAVASDIAASAPDILLVALGFPQKEYFIEKHARRLNAAVILPVGGAFDIYAGAKKRAPSWVQRLGVEWLWRSAYDRSRARLVGRSFLPFLGIVAGETRRRISGRWKTC